MKERKKDNEKREKGRKLGEEKRDNEKGKGKIKKTGRIEEG